MQKLARCMRRFHSSAGLAKTRPPFDLKSHTKSSIRELACSARSQRSSTPRYLCDTWLGHAPCIARITPSLLRYYALSLAQAHNPTLSPARSCLVQGSTSHALASLHSERVNHPLTVSLYLEAMLTHCLIAQS